jgi:predicted RNA-binding Zn-ribbon protein involved in translation (DUF1610 family)
VNVELSRVEKLRLGAHVAPRIRELRHRGGGRKFKVVDRTGAVVREIDFATLQSALCVRVGIEFEVIEGAPALKAVCSACGRIFTPGEDWNSDKCPHCERRARLDHAFARRERHRKLRREREELGCMRDLREEAVSARLSEKDQALVARHGDSEARRFGTPWNKSQTMVNIVAAEGPMLRSKLFARMRRIFGDEDASDGKLNALFGQLLNSGRLWWRGSKLEAPRAPKVCKAKLRVGAEDSKLISWKGDGTWNKSQTMVNIVSAEGPMFFPQLLERMQKIFGPKEASKAKVSSLFWQLENSGRLRLARSGKLSA